MTERAKSRVTGIGGIFFKAKGDPKKLRAWYEKHLGIRSLEEAGGSAVFEWGGETRGSTVWCAFPPESEYFAPSESPFMINYRVEDLHAVLDALRAEGVQVDEKTEEGEYGRFGWIMDPEGNRIELWEPPEGK